MDPLSAVASIVGIVGFGIQIAQILQEEIDAIETATERAEDIVIDISATNTVLANLQGLLLQDHETPDDERIFNDEGRPEFAPIVRSCSTVFQTSRCSWLRQATGVLYALDLFQCQVEEKNKKKKAAKDVKLEIQSSKLEHLM